MGRKARKMGERDGLKILEIQKNGTVEIGGCKNERDEKDRRNGRRV